MASPRPPAIGARFSPSSRRALRTVTWSVGTPNGRPVDAAIASIAAIAAPFFDHPIDRATDPILVPDAVVEIQDRDRDPIHVDTAIVPRLVDRRADEHRRDDEEPGRDRDLPADHHPLAADARTNAGGAGGERAANVERPRQLHRRLETEDAEREQQSDTATVTACASTAGRIENVAAPPNGRPSTKSVVMNADTAWNITYDATAPATASSRLSMHCSQTSRAARRAHRHAHRELALPRGAARQHEVREVGARHQQDQSGQRDERHAETPQAVVFIAECRAIDLRRPLCDRSQSRRGPLIADGYSRSSRAAIVATPPRPLRSCGPPPAARTRAGAAARAASAGRRLRRSEAATRWQRGIHSWCSGSAPNTPR